MKWLYRIVACLRGCRHRWETENIIRVVDDDEYAIGTKYILKCERCGWIKCKRV